MNGWPGCIQKESRLRDSPPAAGRASDIFHSAAVRSTGDFYTIGKELSYRIKKPARDAAEKSAEIADWLHIQKFLNSPFYFSITVEILFPGSIKRAVFPSTRN